MNEQSFIEPIEWRPIRGYEGLYEISNRGEVLSIPGYKRKGGLLKLKLKNSGYLFVTLSKNNTQENVYIHHVVAAAFIGPRPSGYDVNHIDGDKFNNDAGNLEYCTRTENMRHAREHGLHDNRGEKQWNASLTDDQALWIRFASAECGIGDELHEYYGVSKQTVKDVLERRSWKHL